MFQCAPTARVRNLLPSPTSARRPSQVPRRKAQPPPRLKRHRHRASPAQLGHPGQALHLARCRNPDERARDPEHRLQRLHGPGEPREPWTAFVSRKGRVMAYVSFRSLKCHETTGGAGSDQVRIYFKGELIFFSSMKGGRHINIGAGNEEAKLLRSFDVPETVWGKEIDEGSDDIIGTVTLLPNGVQGEQAASMYGAFSRSVPRLPPARSRPVPPGRSPRTLSGRGSGRLSRRTAAGTFVASVGCPPSAFSSPPRSAA